MKRYDFEIGGWMLIAMMVAAIVMTAWGVVREVGKMLGLG